MIDKNIFIYIILMAILLNKAKHLCNFRRGPYEKHFEFGPVVQEEMLFKEFFIYISGCLYVKASRYICAILVDGISRNISVRKF